LQNQLHRQIAIGEAEHKKGQQAHAREVSAKKKACQKKKIGRL